MDDTQQRDDLAEDSLAAVCLCDTFRMFAHLTWGLLEIGRDTGHQPGEETVTDLIVLGLRTAHPRLVRIRTFTKRKEGLEGADWEWWFQSPQHRAIGFRVQAKIVSVASEELRELHYCKKDTTGVRHYQCDDLIQRALKNRPRLIPMYCLYLNWRPSSGGRYGYSTVGEAPTMYGCSVLSAVAVRALRLTGKKKKPSIEDVYESMHPWHHLVCCYANETDDLSQRAWRYWRENIVVTDEKRFKKSPKPSTLWAGEVEGLEKPYHEIRWTEALPPYVTRAIDEDVEPRGRGLRGILVIGGRERK